MQRIVIKLGGSIVAPGSPDSPLITNLATMLKKLSKKYSICVVVGGGKPSREYISVARNLGANNVYCDLIAIGLTRANARILISALGDAAFLEPAKNLAELNNALESKKIAVMGGTTPGHTTDCVAAIAAEYIGAQKLILCKDVKGVYTENPKKNKKAKFLEKLSGDKLISIVSKVNAVAGVNNITDLLAAQIIARSPSKTYIVNGKDIDNINNLLSGKKWIGSQIN